MDQRNTYICSFLTFCILHNEGVAEDTKCVEIPRLTNVRPFYTVFVFVALSRKGNGSNQFSTKVNRGRIRTSIKTGIKKQNK